MADLIARLRRAWRGRFRLSVTREGWWFIGITIVVGLAAMNTGNNLLYLLFAMVLSLVLASGVLSNVSLRGVSVTRNPPLRIHAGRPFLMGIALRNEKKKFPSFSVEVEDLVDGKPLDKKCYFLKIPAGRLQLTSYRHVVPRRGRTRFTGFRLSTKFPFALFRKSCAREVEGEVIVLPAVRPIAIAPPPLRGLHGDDASGRLGRRGDFHGLREYRDGDDPRDVHWRSSARRGRAMVREHEEESTLRIALYLDNALPDGEGCFDLALRDALERAVSLAASLAVHYLERGYAVRLVTRGSAAPWATSTAQSLALLRYLALLPTVDESVPFATAGETRREALLVARRGARRQGGFAQVIEA